MEIWFFGFCLLKIIWGIVSILCSLSLLDYKIVFSIFLQISVPYTKTMLFFIPIGVIYRMHVCISGYSSVSGRVVIYLKCIFSLHLENAKNIKSIFFINWWVICQSEKWKLFLQESFRYGTFLLKLNLVLWSHKRCVKPWYQWINL